MNADNVSKRWQVEVGQNERTHAQNMHINIDNGINGGENTRSGENTHTYPIRRRRRGTPPRHTLTFLSQQPKEQRKPS